MNQKKINRREFLKVTSLGLIGGCLGLRPTSLMGEMRHGDNNIINPSIGNIFKDPVEMPILNISPGIVEVSLDVKVTPVSINGTTANLLTYNSYFPAPTIRVNKGDLLRVHFSNSLPYTTQMNLLGHQKNITNLHTHGWHVSPSDNSDNIFLHFMPDDEFIFEYDTSRQEAGTLNFYHPHVHGLVAEQMWGGLSGALVVNDETDVLADYETHIVVLKDLSLKGTKPTPYTRMDYTMGKEGNIVMVNGQVNPVLPIRPGQMQRWRILNASTAMFYKLSLEKHTFYLVGTDGGLLDRPDPLSQILLSPGERVDVLVRASQAPGTYKLLSLPYNRRGMMMGGMMGGDTTQTITLMTLSYNGTTANENIPPLINPNARRLTINTSNLRKRRLVLSMRMGRGLINGQDFGINPYTITSHLGTYEIWQIINQSGMDHPFHQHVNSSQILSIQGGNQAYASFYTSTPSWKDTIIVPKWGSVTMLVPVMDFTGKTVFHCHIVEHEDIGMMGVWRIV